MRHACSARRLRSRTCDKVLAAASVEDDQALYEAKKQNERRWKMFVGMRA